MTAIKRSQSFDDLDWSENEESTIQDRASLPTIRFSHQAPFLFEPTIGIHEYRLLSNTSALVQKVCATCKKNLPFGTAHKGYCSVKCRQMGK